MAWRHIVDKPLSEPFADPIHWCMFAALGGYELRSGNDSWKNDYYSKNKSGNTYKMYDTYIMSTENLF